MSGEPFNVGLSSANLSKLELCEAIKQFYPNFSIHQAKIGTDPDKRNYIVSNEKLEEIGWAANVDLYAGIYELKQMFPMIENSDARFNNL